MITPLTQLIKALAEVCAVVALCSCAPQPSELPDVTERPIIEGVSGDTVQETQEIFTEEFSKTEIPQEMREKMWNVTITENSPVTFDDLSYLTITYLGYDDIPHIGNMIVADDLADEVLEIFRELYSIGFPIEKMRPQCEYNGDDELSMEDNNTSAFNDRPIEGTNSISNHSLGRAIDINPLINPYIKFSTNTVLPVTAEYYLDRTLDEKGIITEDSAVVEIFDRYGWTWGGRWNSLKDYQHFEK